ncbi:KH domain protein [Trichuris suis]|nr:KH domain protein [Trichuris suis]
MHNGDSSDDQGWHCPPATGGSVCSRGGRKHYRRQRSCNKSSKDSGCKSSNTLNDGRASASENVDGARNGISQGIPQVNGFATNGFASLPEQGNLYIITSPAEVKWNSVNGLNGVNGVSSNGNLYSPSCISESSLDGGAQCATMSANSALPSPAQQALLATPIYNFELPNDLVGLLIGRRGAHVQYLEEMTGASISVYDHASFTKSRLCAIQGTRDAINSCLRLIRKRFPVRTFPHLKLHPVFLPGMLPLLTVPVTIRAAEWQELDLVEGMAIETLVCFAYSPGHFFVHQPTHPSYMHLNQFQAMMSFLYECDGDAMPNLNPIVENTQCAAYCENGWYRAIVCEAKEENGSVSTALVRLLDCGGYFELPVSALKQLRVECTGFPIQANEIILQGVEPADGTDEWSAEAKGYFERLTESTIILTRVSETLPSGAKLSDVYLTNPEHHSLAALLVDNGFAKFVSSQATTA